LGSITALSGTSSTSLICGIQKKSAKSIEMNKDMYDIEVTKIVTKMTKIVIPAAWFYLLWLYIVCYQQVNKFEEWHGNC
jgi:hypothetical protein